MLLGKVSATKSRKNHGNELKYVFSKFINMETPISEKFSGSKQNLNIASYSGFLKEFSIN